MGIKHEYGTFTVEQFNESVEALKHSIVFLLVIVDKKTNGQYEYIDVNKTFINLMFEIDGLNSLLGNPKEIVRTLSLLEEAKKEYNKEDFEFLVYRKLILDSAAEISKLMR